MEDTKKLAPTETKEKNKKDKIDKITAEKDFYDFCEEWEIDYEIENMNEEDSEAFTEHKNKIVKAIKLGRMIFCRNEGTMKYIVSRYTENKEGEEIIIKRPKGSSYMEMDNFKANSYIRKTYAILAGMTGKSVQFFAGLDGIDMKPLQSVMTLFLAS